MSSPLEALLKNDPAAAHKLLAELKETVVVPHSGGQQEVIDSDARYKVLNCGRRYGKRLGLDEPILTPTGWIRMGDIFEGDDVVGIDGKPTKVTGVFPHGVTPMATLTLRCGTQIECGYEHQWLVRRRWRNDRENKYEVLTTQEIIDAGVDIKRPDGRVERQFAIPAPQPVEFSHADLSVPPYTLGVLLGDGALQYTPTISSADPEIPATVTEELKGMALVNKLKTKPGECGMWSVARLGLGAKNEVVRYLRAENMNVRSEHKHVPDVYMTASIEQRRDLLQGLMDTDGWLEGSGNRCAFASASKRLTEAVRELALSLGGKVTPTQLKPTTHLDSHVVRFYMPEGQCPFKLHRKASRWKPTSPERLARQIVSIEPSKPAEAQCISVDADECVYLCRDYTPTHNTKIGVKMMVNEANKPNKPGAKKKLIWWVAPTYKVVKRGYAETLRQIPRGLLEHDPPPETNFDAGRSITLRLKYSNIEFYSAERPGGMLGEGVNFVVLDEAATIPSTVWEQVIRPTLADTKGGGVLLSTPRGRNWFYKRWKAGQSDTTEPDWKSWTFTTYDNPYIDESEIEAMKAEMPTVIFDQEVLAKFVADGSAVFMWEPHQVERRSVLDNGLVEDAKVKGHVFVGVDLAKTADFTVLYGANERDRRNVFYDRFHNVRWSEQKRRIRRAVRLLEKAGADGVTLVMDATGVGDPIVEDMEDAGFDVISVNFTTLKEKMVRRFAKDLESGRAFLLDRAIEEFEDYQMNMTGGGRIQYSAPGGSHDDVVSAKILQHHGITTEGSPNIEILSASEEYDTEAEGEEEFEDEWSDLAYDDEDEEVSPQEPVQPSPEEIFARPEAWS